MAKKGLDTATVIGLALGLGSLAGAMTLEFQELNPDFGSAFLKLSALLIIFGGTMGCTMLSFRIEEIMRIPTYLKIALYSDHYDEDKLIDQVRNLAEIARRDGILAIESKRDELGQTYPFLADGFQFVIDGTPPDKVKELLANEIVSMEERHKVGSEIFGAMGGYAPTMGIIGTVVGLIGALAKAGEGGEDPTAVVKAIATAFIATFYGIASANLFFLPIATKLQRRTLEEVSHKIVQVEGILATQNGDNPRVVSETLKTFFRKKPRTEA